MSKPASPPFIGQLRYVKQHTFNTHHRVVMQQYTPEGWKTVDVNNPEWETEEDAAKYKKAVDDGILWYKAQQQIKSLHKKKV